MPSSKETILVTGSSGYLGYPIANHLSTQFSVVGFDRKAAPHPPPTAECLYVDVTSEPSLARALDAVRVLHGDRLASVIHFAAYYDFAGAPSPQYERVTVRGTQRLLRMLRERFTVEQFIFSSTMLVHAPTVPGRPITEESPLEPKWPYPQSKVDTEKIIRAERGDTPVVILRIAGVYDDNGHSVPLPRQIQRIFERAPEAYVYPGDMKNGQAMIHLHDVVALFELVVTRRQQLSPDLTLLAGESKTMGYGDLQDAIGRLIYGQPWQTQAIPPGLAKVGAWLQEHLPLDGKPFVKPWMIEVADDHYELDISRARTLLGWEPKHSLRATLPIIINRLVADPWAWYRENELSMPIWLQETEPAPAAAPIQDVYGPELQGLLEILQPHDHAGPVRLRKQ